MTDPHPTRPAQHELAPPELEALASSVESLAAEFAGVFSRHTVSDCVHDSFRALLPAKVATYVPLLAHRFARERLHAAARITRPAEQRTPLVLFICTGNSGRSIMAAAALRHAANGTATAASAGTAPAGEVQPEVLAALAERGVDASEEFPKPLTPEVVESADVVVTMCDDACEVLPGRRYLNWDFPDPHGQDLPEVRDILDAVSDHVSTLLMELSERNADSGVGRRQDAGR